MQTETKPDTLAVCRELIERIDNGWLREPGWEQKSLEAKRDSLQQQLYDDARLAIAAEERRREAAPDLLDLLEEAMPYVEEGEQFNKPSCRTLSKRIRAAIARATA